MKPDIVRFLTHLSLLLCLGCASREEPVRLPDAGKPIENPAKVRICVIRPEAVFGSASRTPIYDGDTEIGSTGPQTYLCWERKPGRMVIRAKSENDFQMALKADAGRTYYLVQTIHMGVMYPRSSMEVISEEEATELFKNCKPAPSK